MESSVHIYSCQKIFPLSAEDWALFSAFVILLPQLCLKTPVGTFVKEYIVKDIMAPDCLVAVSLTLIKMHNKDFF